MNFPLLACLLAALAAIPLPLAAQSDVDADPPSGGKRLNLRLIALGHRRLAQFERSEEARVIKIQTPDGKTIEETIPRGVPIEVQGERFEYLPSLVYLRERGLRDGKKHLVAPLVLNSATPYHRISTRGQVKLLLRQPQQEPGSEPAFTTYAAADVAEGQSHMVLALINRFNETEGWRQPIVKSFDVSPARLPGGSVFLFNGTPFPMEVDIKVRDSFEKVTIEPMATKSYRLETDSTGRSLLRAHIVARNGFKKQIYLNSVKVGETGRTFLFAYYDPRKKTSNPAGLVQFSDVLLPVNED